MLNTHTDNLLQVYDTYIELPSGRQISLDCQNAFTPNSDFDKRSLSKNTCFLIESKQRVR